MRRDHYILLIVSRWSWNILRILQHFTASNEIDAKTLFRIAIIVITAHHHQYHHHQNHLEEAPVYIYLDAQNCNHHNHITSSSSQLGRGSSLYLSWCTGHWLHFSLFSCHSSISPFHEDDSATAAAADDDDDMYIMMQCLCVCNEKSALPPGSLL